MTRVQANGLVLLAAALWGTGNVAQQQLLSFMGPMLANGLRCFVAFLFICPLMLLQPNTRKAIGEPGWILLALSALAFTLATTLNQASLAFTTVTANGVLVNTCMIMTPFVALVLIRERPSALVWPATIIAFAGATVMTGGSLTKIGPGEILCLLAAVGFAVWMVLLSHFVKLHGRAVLASATQFLCAGATSTIMSLTFESNATTQIMASWQVLLMAGIIGTAGGYFLMALAQEKTSASETAIIGSMEAVFAALAGFLVLGDRLPPHAYAGLVIIICGIMLSQVPEQFFLRTMARKTVNQTQHATAIDSR